MQRAFLFSLLFLAGAAGAQEAFPSRNVHFIVPYTPGTAADILARMLAPRLAERWKIAVVTENKAGATGNIGTEFVAKSPPDGHTLLFAATSFATNSALNPKLAFDPLKSFAPVTLAATSSLAVVLNPNVPASSMSEFVTLARRQPGKLHYSSPGNGGIQHLAMELLKADARFDVVHVPYKGLGGAMADVVAGHVEAMVVGLFTASANIQSGKLRAVAVMSGERSPAFSDVPTLREQGLPGLEVETWYAVFAPAATPPNVIAALNSSLNALLREAQIRELLAKQGMSAAGGTPEQLGDLVKRELARWTRVVAAARIKAD
jgi:tripartite-type tricarboxylate transporter receptor subunit TctC